MKFFLMRGRTDYDGQVSFNSDMYYSHQNYLEEIDEKYWCIRYNDEIAPAESDTELSTGEHRSLTQDEINTFSALAERLQNEAKIAMDAAIAAEQKQDDEEYMRNYITWSVRAKKSRDEMLASSDPYILLSHLDDTGWEAWRQWVRDLPQQHDAPMNIDSWTEPPTNANDMVSDIFTKFKRNCETSKKLYDHYYP